jgi:hypothetical protein
MKTFFRSYTGSQNWPWLSIHDGDEQTLENTEVAIKNGQSREISNIGYARRRQTKQNLNTICLGHYYAQISTNNVNKTIQFYFGFMIH